MKLPRGASAASALGLTSPDVPPVSSSVGWVSLAVAQPGAPRPHIVYIVSDDQGWKDVGFHGFEIKTPHIDRLAQGGVRLEQFYAQPMCRPSRAALMTGRYPHRYGLQTAVILSPGRYGLATDEWLLPQALKEAGYRTAIVGKWHLGHADRKYWPRQRGFDYQSGPMLGEIDYFTHSAHGTRGWFRNNQPVREQGYVQLADQNPQKVAELQQWAQTLARDAAQPLILQALLGAVKQVLMGSVTLPGDDRELERQP